ncbi:MULTISPECIES: sensor histidine kinase [Gracilibacillus]|uniref:sensor histidine kinase n=1 Tax=Gracilibacillus TaxID=74385 RepID=UPI000AB4D23C|nr:MULTISPECIES: sensor histidine kinase [Gracilibacillus]
MRMIKLRTKLLLYFLVILVSMVALFLIREWHTQRIVSLHEENSEHYFLLNELTNSTDLTLQSLQIFVHEPTENNKEAYQQEKQQLQTLTTDFEQKIRDSMDKQNYLSLLTSFQEYADETITLVEQDHIEQYASSLNETDRTADYIHEKTLEFINQQLTEYQHIIELENQRIEEAKKTGSFVFLTIILLSILFALWFSNGATKVIEKLTSASKEISQGHYNIPDVQVSQRDELRVLTDTFNRMKYNIVEAISEMKEKAKMSQLLKEMELKSLQNQVNPHFLFNTLNVISKTSYIEGADKTSDLIHSISALLRYNLGNLDRETSLKDEVAVVNEYFFLQQSRFGDRITFEQNIEEDCLHVAIPCLTLQPLIENAFVHGIEEMAEDAVITLAIFSTARQVVIEVSDNGKGMSQAKIAAILNHQETDREQKGHSTGIGLRNVMERLKIFDKSSDVAIVSEVGKGTTVRITLDKGRTT